MPGESLIRCAGAGFFSPPPRDRTYRLLAATLAAGGALAIGAFRAGTAACLAALGAGAGSVRGIGAGEAEARDDGEHGARFDQCFHGVFCVV